jgi:hypothetical protein
MRGGCDPDPEPAMTGCFGELEVHFAHLAIMRVPTSSSKLAAGSGSDPPWSLLLSVCRSCAATVQDVSVPVGAPPHRRVSLW